MRALLVERWPYVLTVLMLLIGLHGMLVKRNLMKKLIGMNIFQGAIILFFIVYGYKTGGTVPVLDPEIGADPTRYDNPIPHGLMLTAIVVSVATTGVALALLMRIYRAFGTIDEAELLERMNGGESP
ncbi:cation:proton antiporter subunit C [Candidatus Binatia bacterium]|nr:cation:proton antiporter subunit C [Candidatus Binatia bacterium]